MCHPSEEYRLGDAAPPTLVAMPRVNGLALVSVSHRPQKPTYAFGPTRSMAVSITSGSAAVGWASWSPGWSAVPRWYTTAQSSELVPGPEPVSSTWFPAIIRCSGSRGSIENGLENCAVLDDPSPGGFMLLQVFPPSVVAATAPYTYSP